MLKYRFSLLILVCFFWASAAQGQDIMRDHRINALKGLKDVQLVFRPTVKSEVLSRDEIEDYLELILKKRIPELRVKNKGENLPWLELSYITHYDGGLIGIILYRWVTVIATGEIIFATVWNDQRIFLRGMDRNGIREVIDEIVLKLAVEFMRANQKGERN